MNFFRDRPFKRLAYFSKFCQDVFAWSLIPIGSFWIQFWYFLAVTLIGLLSLYSLEPRKDPKKSNLDMFYMSASATTSSSLGSVEMEDFSNAQLVVLTVLMLLGGEIFTSMLGLQIRKFMSNDKSQKTNLRVITRENHHSNPFKIEKEIDLESITNENNDPDLRVSNGVGSLETKIEGDLKLNSLRLLRNVVLCYYSVIHIFGTALIAMYLSLASHAKHLLRSRGIQMLTFSAFLTVSSFANCGFVPTNENMIAFKKDTLLLLLIIPQFLLGNTLFPSCLRLVISFLRRLTRREEFGYLLENYKQIGFDHLFSFEESVYLFLTVSGFIVVQFVVFFWLQWNSEAFSGFGNGEKVVAGLFLSVNTRYSGESVVDLSLLKPALLVLYCLMMYLHPYTCFLPTKERRVQKKSENQPEKGRKGENLIKKVLFSQPTNLVVFVIIICITEQRQLLEDPLNFNVLNIVFEVLSAYGNVGLSVGYSCQKLHKLSNKSCKDVLYSFSGQWSKEGKLVIIFVMFFGKLKKFRVKDGKSWLTL